MSAYPAMLQANTALVSSCRLWVLSLRSDVPAT